ncbi:MAG: hypothetical protein H8E28_06945 [Anaerolineae bacterium]|nr:hypothetical protein [Anaerolineae bacterium]
MKKFFNKWTRVFHRWIALPTLIIIPLAVIAKFTGDGAEHLPPQLEQFQSILMLLLAISGAYLYLIPYLAKWARNKRKQTSQADVTRK